MTSTSPPAGPKADAHVDAYADVVGHFGEAGYVILRWTTPRAVEQLRIHIQGLTAPSHASPVTRNPHLSLPKLGQAIAAPALLERVCSALGPTVAVENTFLMIKAPGSDFTVPLHQDGINDRLVLDPSRAVAAWLAITPATSANGGLELAAGSHLAGYLPYTRSDAPGNPLGALDHRARIFTTPELVAGEACLMDVRLLHRSGRNSTTTARIGLNVRYVAPGAIRLRDGTQPSLSPIAGTWPAS